MKQVNRVLTAVFCIVVLLTGSIGVTNTYARYDNAIDWQSLYAPRPVEIESDLLTKEGYQVLLKDWILDPADLQNQKSYPIQLRTDGESIAGKISCQVEQYGEYVTASVSTESLTIDQDGESLDLNLNLNQSLLDALAIKAETDAAGIQAPEAVLELLRLLPMHLNIWVSWTQEGQETPAVAGRFTIRLVYNGTIEGPDTGEDGEPSARVSNVVANPGEIVTIPFTIYNVYGVNGEFTFTNPELILSKSYGSSGMTGDVANDRAFFYGVEKASVTIPVTLEISPEAKAGDQIAVTFTYEHSDAYGNMSETLTITGYALLRGTPEPDIPETSEPESGTPEPENPETGEPESGTPEPENPETGEPEGGTTEPENPESSTPEAEIPAPETTGTEALANASTEAEYAEAGIAAASLEAETGEATETIPEANALDPIEPTSTEENTEETQTDSTTDTGAEETTPEDRAETNNPSGTDSGQPTAPEIVTELNIAAYTESFHWQEWFGMQVSASEDITELVVQYNGSQFPKATRYQLGDNPPVILGEWQEIRIPHGRAGQQVILFRMEQAEDNSKTEHVILGVSGCDRQGNQMLYEHKDLYSNSKALSLELGELVPVVQTNGSLEIPCDLAGVGFSWYAEHLTQDEVDASKLVYKTDTNQFGLSVSLSEQTEAEPTVQLTITDRGMAAKGSYRLVLTKQFAGYKLAEIKLPIFIQ